MKKKIFAVALSVILAVTLMCATLTASAESSTLSPSDLTYIDNVSTTVPVDIGEMAESIISDKFGEDIEGMKEPLEENSSFIKKILESMRSFLKMIQEFVYKFADTISGLNVFN